MRTNGITSIKAKKSRNHSELLCKYLNLPIKIKSNKNYDFIKIQAFRYVPDLNIQRANTTTVREDGKVTQGKAYGVSLQGTGKRITETVGPQIFLPMTPSISETNNVGWGPDSLNPLQRRFGQAAIQSIDQASGGDFRGAIGTQQIKEVIQLDVTVSVDVRRTTEITCPIVQSRSFVKV